MGDRRLQSEPWDRKILVVGDSFDEDSHIPVFKQVGDEYVFTGTFVAVGGAVRSDAGGIPDGVADGQIGPLQMDEHGNLRVVVSGGGGGGGTSATDDTAFVFGSEEVTPTGFVVDEDGSSVVGEDQVGVARMSPDRIVLTRIQDGHDAALGTTTDAAITSDTNGTAIGFLRGLIKILTSVWDSINGRLKVDGSGVTQPVSGTIAISNFPATQPISGSVTANQGTSPWIIGFNGIAQPVIQSGVWSILVSNFPTIQKVDGSGVTQPVSGIISSSIISSPALDQIRRLLEQILIEMKLQRGVEL